MSQIFPVSRRIEAPPADRAEFILPLPLDHLGVRVGGVSASLLDAAQEHRERRLQPKSDEGQPQRAREVFDAPALVLARMDSIDDHAVPGARREMERQTRSFCFVSDLVEGLLKLMESPAGQTGPINLGNPGEFTMHELASLVLEKTKSSSKIVFRPLPTDDPKQRCPDIRAVSA